MCDFCDGEGKVCSKCDQSRRRCECTDTDFFEKPDPELSGYDPVECTHCEGSGE